MVKVFDINGNDLESKSQFTSVTMPLSEDTLKMIDYWYPILEEKGLVKNKTQTSTYLARLGSEFLEQYKQGKDIYVGKDLNNLVKANIIDFLRKL